MLRLIFSQSSQIYFTASELGLINGSKCAHYFYGNKRIKVTVLIDQKISIKREEEITKPFWATLGNIICKQLCNTDKGD